jgi:hypothetical protein
MREEGWLQEVFKAATKRVDDWPEWKKVGEVKASDSEHDEPGPRAKKRDVNQEK